MYKVIRVNKRDNSRVLFVRVNKGSLIIFQVKLILSDYEIVKVI
jgi:hypothetical protein